MARIIEKITELGLTNASDADAAATLSVVTSGPIAVDQVLFFLASNGLFEKDATDGTATGSLAAIITDENADAQLRSGLREFVNHLHRPGSQEIATHQTTWALKAAGLLSVLQSAAVVTSQQVAAFYQLDGGLLFPSGVTEQQVATARADQAALQLKENALEAIKTRANAAMEAAGEEFRKADSTAASITAAGEGAF